MIKNLFFNIERVIYIIIRNGVKVLYIKNIFLYDFNSNKLTLNLGQEKIINRLQSDVLNKKQDFIFIEGGSNTGKTTTIYHCFENGIDDINLFKMLDGKIIYICKSYSTSQIYAILKKYLLKKYSNYIIIVDDMGDYSMEVQLKFVHSIIKPYIVTGRCFSKLLVFIGKDESSLIFSQLSDFESGEHVITLKNESYCLEDAPENFRSFCRKYRVYNVNTKKWLLNVFKSKTGEEILYNLMNHEDIKLYTLFVCIIIISHYSGTFKKKELKKLYKHLAKKPLFFNSILEKLLEARIVSFFPMYNHTLCFNKNVSSYFREKIMLSKQYINGIIFYYNNILNTENYVEKWLLYVECYALGKSYINIIESKLIFKKAFMYGNYNYLLDNAENIFKKCPYARKDFYQELGYLYEKVGNRKEAITLLTNFIKITKDSFEEQQTQLLLFEILHHDNQDMRKINQLVKSSNEFISFQARYWKEHIKIEKGSFSFDALYNIIVNYTKNSFIWKENLNYFHILRRMFSDLVRVYFLNGEINIKKFNCIKNLMNESELKSYHSEYNDYYRLFFSAHYIHYDVVFQLGFYKYLIHKCDNNVSEKPELEKCIEQGLYEYEKCEKNFKSCGDKAWRTVSIRKNELSIASDVQLINVIQDLESLQLYFNESQNYLHLAFTNCVLCKAKFIQFFLNNMDSDFTLLYNDCISLLNESHKLYKKFNNEYGIYRIEFIKLFLDFFHTLELKDSESKFRHSLNNLKNNKYNREYEMIEFILQKKHINSDLIYRFFKFFPIILQ